MSRAKFQYTSTGMYASASMKKNGIHASIRIYIMQPLGFSIIHMSTVGKLLYMYGWVEDSFPRINVSHTVGRKMILMETFGG